MTQRSFNTKRVLGFAASAGMLVGGLVASAPQEANAEYRRTHPSACQVTTNSGDLSIASWYSVRGQTATLLCPLPDESSLANEDIGSISVYTHDGASAGGNFVRVTACGVGRNIFLSQCGSSQTASGSGFKTLTLSTSSEIGWMSNNAYASYYPYLQVYMTSNSSINEQRFMGYTVAD